MEGVILSYNIKADQNFSCTSTAHAEGQRHETAWDIEATAGISLLLNGELLFSLFSEEQIFFGTDLGLITLLIPAVLIHSIRSAPII